MHPPKLARLHQNSLAFVGCGVGPTSHPKLSKLRPHQNCDVLAIDYGGGTFDAPPKAVWALPEIVMDFCLLEGLDCPSSMCVAGSRTAVRWSAMSFFVACPTSTVTLVRLAAMRWLVGSPVTNPKRARLAISLVLLALTAATYGFRVVAISLGVHLSSSEWSPL